MSPSGLWSGLARLYLGSKSWSRRQLLEEMGVTVSGIVVSDFDESTIRDPDPRKLVLALAHAKADALLRNPEVLDLQTAMPTTAGTTLLVTGDSVVTHKNRVLEKPSSKQEARELLTSYASSPATTVSSIVVVNLGSLLRYDGVAAAEVYFRPLPPAVIEELVESGASMETAGGLRIEHPIVQPYIECIIGEKSAVMGFCQTLAEKLIREALNRAGDCASKLPDFG
jgi:septum formation protein